MVLPRLSMMENSNQSEPNLVYSEPNSEVSESTETQQSVSNSNPSIENIAEEQPTSSSPETIGGPLLEDLHQEIANLKQQLLEQTEKAESFKTQYLRIAADFDNFRKRTLKDKENLELQVKRNTITELLPVIDNFERARTQIKPATDGEMDIYKSYQGVYRIFVDSLKKIGVSAMRPEGQPFDPNFHEAMLREPSTEYPEGTVIEQLVRGYLLNDQVLRHAMVKVAAPPEESESPDSSETEIETN